MQTTCAGIILSGGLNSRMGGRNKAFLELGGRSFINRILSVLEECFDQLLLVTKQPQFYDNQPIRIVEDIFNLRTPLAGIHAGLVNMTTDYGFATSCDTPLLKTELVRMLVSEIDIDVDIVAPASGSYYQPLCAVYSKRCIPFIEDRLGRGDVKTDSMYETLKVKRIPYEQLQVVDPKLESFFNINTPEDLKFANQTAQNRERPHA
jgi:molybdopterin-guanine dinucleotide biosynthesis protein A